MIQSVLFTASGKIQNIKIDEIDSVIKGNVGFLWVDMDSESAENSKSILQEKFRFHPLAIDDALLETHIPKVDNWDTYLYLVLRTLKKESQEPFEISTPEIDIFLGPNYLVTYHNEPIPAIQKVWEHCYQDIRYLSRGPGFLVYQIADEVINNSMTLIEEMDVQIDQIEDEVFANPQPKILENIFSIKRVVLQLRRTLLPQKEVFNKLARGDFNLIREDDQVYFRDAYDHMLRLQEINESSRDLISGALDTYLSVINNRMNNIMKTLTIITTLFMPLSFITGFFGMNFFMAVIPLETWTGALAFGLVLVGIFLIPVGMYLWMRRRAWM